VGVLGTAVQVAAGPAALGQDLSLRDAVAAEPIGHDAPRPVLEAGQQALEEAFGRRGIAALLHEDVEYDTVLAHRALETEEFAVDLQAHFVHVPNVTRLRAALAQLGCELRAEAEAPSADALVADHHASLGEKQLIVSKAQADEVIKPDCIRVTSAGKRCPG
jgi:hypothetical protein